ncbi:uncharacterized protein LOC143246233 [Tachypleus tridentatus]|uniref:uncharacterized protein LOC143246233 n=1 Tax=Tachypleus tridentatus TaxID=6853 RepID=UPI003FD6BE26
MRLLRSAWSLVKQSTIANCFRTCGFSSPEPAENSEDPEDDIPLAQLLTRLNDSGFTVDGTAEDYETADNDLITSAPLTDSDIVAMVQKNRHQKMTVKLKMTTMRNPHPNTFCNS